MGSVGHRHRKDSLGNADGRRLRARASELEASVSSVSSVVPVGGSREPGSEALPDARAERYCQKIVAGVEQLEAYWQAFYDDEGKDRAKRSTVLSLRARLGSKADVLERIKWLNGKGGVGTTTVTKAEKASMLDTLLKKTYDGAMSEGASAKDVGAFLDVLARHDMVNGDIVAPKLEVVFPQMDELFGALAKAGIERRLGIKTAKKAEGEIIEDAKSGASMQKTGALEQKSCVEEQKTGALMQKEGSEG